MIKSDARIEARNAHREKRSVARNYEQSYFSVVTPRQSPSLLAQREGKVKAKRSIGMPIPEISPRRRDETRRGEERGREKEETFGMEDQARDYDTMVSRAESLMTARIPRRDRGREAKEVI